jgi:flagellar assembly protein FliH
MGNVIEKQELEKHTIQRYRFKVLGSNILDDDLTQDDNLADDSNEVQIPTEKIEIKENENKFIEDLLKKSDELSSNIIKLQMQIEKQEDSFKTRLEQEVAREKETATKDGYEKAKLEIQENLNSTILNYKDSARKLDEKIKEMDIFLNKMQNDIADTAIEVAKEVVKKEISSAGSSVALALSKELLSELKEANAIVLKVNPDDFSALNDIYKDNDKITVEEDKAISKGGVVLLSKNGNLDGNISQRFEKVKNLLQNN